MPMRLTLRTLLAYLDEIPLPQEEVEALRARIDESEFAQGLIQRIRSVLRRLRLGAPRVDAKGAAVDANTVAEYLDNTLPADRVADFERVCLESDVQLAEVAGCHQILALVVSEPAEIPPDLREKIYRLPETHQQQSDSQSDSAGQPIGDTVAGVEPVAATTGTGLLAGGRSAATSAPAVARPQVPDYLRAARRQAWRPWLATASLVALLLAAAIMALGPLDASHPLLGWLFRPPQATGVPTSDPSTMVARTEIPAQPAAAQESATQPAAGEAGSSSPPPELTAPETQAAAASEPEPSQPSATGGETSGQTATVAAEANPMNTGMAEPASSGSPIAGTSRPESGPPPGAATAPAAPDSPPSELARPSSQPSGLPEPGRSPTPTVSGASSPDAAAPAPVVEVGRFLPGERRQVLARFDAAQQLWFRLPERELLKADERLLVLPTFRPQLAFSSGVQALLIGPCSVQMLGDQPPQPSGMALVWGSALLDTAGVAGSTITLRLAGHIGQLRFMSSDATLAMEVTRQLPWGSDPAVVGSLGTARLVATSGQFEWLEGAQPPVSWQQGEELVLVEGLPAARHKTEAVPDWVSGPQLRDIDLRASRELEPLLAVQKPLHLSLQEQVVHRQVEVAALAIQSLVALGQVEPAVLALSQERFSLYWRVLIESLQRAAVEQPAVAADLRRVLQQQRPEDAAVLYRLFWGFTNEQLQAGDDQRLVQMLEHPALDVRVLAFDNLQRITGKTFLYRPERDPALQRRPLQEWRSALAKGEIRWPNAAARAVPATAP
ncbi:MAG: hypothetical protein KatS3mg110_1398 [Pirellulaceae bacterium]|nr:MAG: hypothetical protein KatS3mg110_1398 [Pirellulaceae bacterium]